MEKRELKEKSRYLSYILRHNPTQENLTMDDNGYVSVKVLTKNLEITKDDLDWIVENNNKKRFAYNDDETRIRASQGHSVNVDLGLKVILPPPVLYHGTTIDNKKSIEKDGIKKMNRHHVHLTWDYMTAYDVGLRYAKYNNKVLIYSIDSEKMNKNGCQFFKTENNVFLVHHVPAKYLTIEKHK